MSKKSETFDEYVINPGYTIEELLEANYMAQQTLAEKTGISPKTINEIIMGKAPITQSTALKFSYVFNMPASFFNNLESNYQSALERKEDFESIVKEEKYLDKIPYNEMVKRNWPFIEKTNSKVEKVINLRKFFSVSSLDYSEESRKKIAFRKSNNKNFSYEALNCMLRYAEIESNKDEYPKYNIDKLKDNAKKIRKLANSSFLKQFDKIRELLRECGIALVFEKHLPKTYVNGVTYKITYNKAIILITDRGKKDDILWFTLFHEIAHLIKHSQKEIFIDFDKPEVNDIEREADKYAQNILIPDKIYKKYIKEGHINRGSILNFSNENNISPGILIGRMQKDKIISWSSYNDLIERIN